MPERSSKKSKNTNVLASQIVEEATGETILKPEDANKNTTSALQLSG